MRRTPDGPIWLVLAALVLFASPRPVAAQGWEMVGGSVGSAAGIFGGAVWSGASEGTLDDLLVGVTVGSAVGSAAGAYLGGRLSGGGPSVLGALLGGALGTVVAVGVSEVLDRQLRGEPAVLVFIGYTVSQGTVAGLGAWLLGDHDEEPEPPP